MILQEKIKEIELKLKSYSRGLENKNYLINKSWTVVDWETNIQRLIFKSNGVLYIATDGNVIESTWEYLPAINALVLKVGEAKQLFYEVYINHVALILKKDGLKNEYVALVNPEKLPDLDLEDYIRGFEIQFKFENGNQIPYNKNKGVFQKLLNFINGS